MSLEEFGLLSPRDPEKVLARFGKRDFETEVAALLLHQLKVGQPWQPFIECLNMKMADSLVSEDSFVSEDSLFLRLFSMVDEDVRRTMVTAQLKRGPVPIWLGAPESRWCRELYWGFTERPILAFLKLSPEPLGTSSLINDLFATDFETDRAHRDAYAQIQLDEDFLNPGRGFAVVDSHGLAALPLQRAAAEKFQFVAIHTTASELRENQSRGWSDFLRELQDSKRCRQVFLLLNATGPGSKDAVRIEKSFPKVKVLRAPGRTRAKHSVNTLRKELVGILLERLRFQEAAEGGSAAGLGKYLLHEEDGGVLSRKDLLQIVNGGPKRGASLVHKLAAEVGGSSDEHFGSRLPMHKEYETMCLMDRVLKAADSHRDRHLMQEYNARRLQAKDAMRDIPMSPFAKRVCEVLLSEESAVLLADLGQLAVQKGQAHNLLLAEVQRRLSMLHRELQLLVSYSDRVPQQQKEAIIKAYAELAWRGLPFELIDGDAWHMNEHFLDKVLASISSWMDQRPVLVTSTVGPQSSGKSTLMNAKFGTRFGVAEGRCSRGVYAQLLRTEDSAVLVLDTEGLQSVEKRDPEFDRRVMLFTMAVSNMIDINIKGNLNEPFKRLITVCVRALHHLQMAKMPSPNLNWIINQVQDTDPSHHREAFLQIRTELEEVFAQDPELLRVLIKLNSDKITALPSKFAERSIQTHTPHGAWTRLEANDRFGLAMSQLLTETLEAVPHAGSASMPANHYDLRNWLALSADVFQTITSYPDLTYFADIRQVWVEEQLRRWVGEQMDKIRDPVWVKQFDAAVVKLCSPRNDVDSVLQQVAQSFEQKWGDIPQRFDAEARRFKAEVLLARSKRQSLEWQLGVCRAEWRARVQSLYHEGAVQRQCSQGAEKLRAEVRRLQRGGGAGTKKAARHAFNKVWDSILQDMRSAFKQADFDYDLLKSMQVAYPVDGAMLEGFEVIERISRRGERWAEAPDFEFGKGTFMEIQPPHPADSRRSNATRADVTRSCEPPAKNPGGADPCRPCAAEEPMSYAVHGLQAASAWGAAALQELVEVWNIMKGQSQSGQIQRPSQLRSDPELAAKSWRNLLDQLHDRVKSLLPEGRQPSPTVMFRISQEVGQLEEQANRGLRQYGLQVSRRGRGSMDLFALLASFHHVKGLLWRSYMKPIEDFDKEKPQQWKFFQAAVLQDTSVDEAQAGWLADELARHLARKQDDLCLDDCHRLQGEHQGLLSRGAVQGRADALLGTDNLEDQERYIQDPAKFMEQDLESKLDQLRSEIAICTEQRARRWKTWQEQLERVAAMLRDELPPEKADAADLFQVRGQTKDPSLTQQLQRVAAAQYVVRYITEAGELPRTFEVAAKEGEEPWTMEVTGRVPCIGEACGDLELAAALKGFFEGIQHMEAGNIHTFAATLASKLQGFQASPPDFPLTQQAASSFEEDCRDKLVPCPVRCPCCDRLCDNPDIGPGHIHRFSQGHQVRGFRGIFLDDGKRTASTKICSQMKDDDIFVDEEGKRSTWRDFKALHPDFDFSDAFSKDRYDREGRWFQAWSKLGPRFCARYNTRFTELGEQGSLRNVPLHFLLVLDESPSMIGSKWEALRQAVSKLLDMRAGTPNDRFSTVLFAGQARVHFAMSDGPSANRFTAAMQQRGWGTCYRAGFEEALGVLRGPGATHGYHRHVVVFMSDGLNNRGNWAPVAQELKDEFGPAIVRSYTIGFGSEDFTELRLAAQVLGGEFVNSITEADLVTTFAEIAQPRASVGSLAA